MCHENTQVEFEFGSGLIIFGIGVRQFLGKSHIHTLQSPRGHPCCIDSFLVCA